MDIAIGGPGEVVIRFIDPRGRTLLQEKLVISGSSTVQARRTIALHVETTTGRVLVSPVLVRQSNPQQKITFDNEPPARFAARRCQEIGCATDIVNDVERACAASPIHADTAVLMSDDQAMYKLIQAAAGKQGSRAPQDPGGEQC